MTESLLSDSLVNHFKFIYNINLWEKKLWSPTQKWNGNSYLQGNQ